MKKGHSNPTYYGEHIIVCIMRNQELWSRVMRPSLLFRGSRPGLFYDLSAGDSCPLRIVPQAGPAVSPADKT